MSTNSAKSASNWKFQQYMHVPWNSNSDPLFSLTCYHSTHSLASCIDQDHHNSHHNSRHKYRKHTAKFDCVISHIKKVSTKEKHFEGRNRKKKKKREACFGEEALRKSHCRSDCQRRFILTKKLEYRYSQCSEFVENRRKLPRAKAQRRRTH